MTLWFKEPLQDIIDAIEQACLHALCCQEDTDGARIYARAYVDALNAVRTSLGIDTITFTETLNRFKARNNSNLIQKGEHRAPTIHGPH